MVILSLLFCMVLPYVTIAPNNIIIFPLFLDFKYIESYYVFHGGQFLLLNIVVFRFIHAAIVWQLFVLFSAV